MLFNVPNFQRNQWRYQRLINNAYTHVVNQGEQQFSGFSGFSDEVFHRFISPKPDRIEDPAPGQDVFERLHAAMDEVPEVQDLRERCMHDEDWSASATNTILQTLLKGTEEPEEQIPSSEEAMEQMQAMKQLLERRKESGAPQEVLDRIDEEVQRLGGKAKENAAAAAKFAATMDDTNMREAVREGVRKAKEKIDKETSALDGLPGTSDHSGKRAKRALSSQISGILTGNERVQEILELAGRLKRIAMEEQTKKPRKGVDEYCGIEMGDALERLVPSEWAMSDDPDLEPLFWRKLNERALSQFEITARPRKQRGPIVFLLDTTGSMRPNHAAEWAAAVALAFLQVAIKQGRTFALLHFATDVLRTDVFRRGEGLDHARLLESVGFFAAAGGTNYMKPVSQAMDLIESDGGFDEADIVMCTDGHASITNEWLSDYEKKKSELEFSTYSILVGNHARPDTLHKFSDDVVHLADMLQGDEAMHKFFRAV
jgi:uncharacterized protein with von Willebrand factor type A (vWA) domain